MEFIIDLEERTTYIDGADGMMQWIITDSENATAIRLKYPDICRCTFFATDIKIAINNCSLYNQRNMAFAMLALIFTIDKDFVSITEAAAYLGGRRSLKLKRNVVGWITGK